MQATTASSDRIIEDGWYILQHVFSGNFIGVGEAVEASLVIAMTDDGRYEESCYKWYLHRHGNGRYSIQNGATGFFAHFPFGAQSGSHVDGLSIPRETRTIRETGVRNKFSILTIGPEMFLALRDQQLGSAVELFEHQSSGRTQWMLIPTTLPSKVEPIEQVGTVAELSRNENLCELSLSPISAFSQPFFASSIGLLPRRPDVSSAAGDETRTESEVDSQTARNIITSGRTSKSPTGLVRRMLGWGKPVPRPVKRDSQVLGLVSSWLWKAKVPNTAPKPFIHKRFESLTRWGIKSRNDVPEVSSSKKLIVTGFREPRMKSPVLEQVMRSPNEQQILDKMKTRINLFAPRLRSVNSGCEMTGSSWQDPKPNDSWYKYNGLKRYIERTRK